MMPPGIAGGVQYVATAAPGRQDMVAPGGPSMQMVLANNNGQMVPHIVSAPMYGGPQYIMQAAPHNYSSPLQVSPAPRHPGMAPMQPVFLNPNANPSVHPSSGNVFYVHPQQ